MAVTSQHTIAELDAAVAAVIADTAGTYGATSDDIWEGTATVARKNGSTYKFGTVAGLFSTPQPIGDGTPNTGAFTTLIATTTLSLVATTSSTTGVILKGANRFIHSFSHLTGGGAVPVGFNTFIGVDAGNFTMGSTATETYHGSYNTAAGYQALYSNTTGYYNTAAGYQAGRYVTGGSTANETSNTSVYLGGETKASADGNANEIVIGHNTTGFGSNTAAYGNASITAHIFQKGALRIGTTTATTHGEEVLRAHLATGAKTVVVSAGDSGPAKIHFVNSTTGSTSSDGFGLGINASEQAVLYNNEPTETLFYTAATERMRLSRSAANLLLGGTTDVTTGSGCLALFTLAAPTAVAANSIALYSSDLSAGNTIPSFWTEGTAIYAAGTPAAATGSIAIRVNGTVYHLTASTTAAS